MQSAGKLDTIVKIAPTEVHERIGKVERAHSLLRRVYSKLKLDLPRITKFDRLSLTFRAINDSPSPNSGVSPTALVFGVHPKIPGGGNRGTYAQCAKIVAECTKLATEVKSQRIIRDAKKDKTLLMSLTFKQ